MPTETILQSEFLARFTCLGDACEDTCCKGWGMQVDSATLARYEKQAPELLDAVTTGEAKAIMRRDPKTDYCVKFDQGWCGIQKQYGTSLLGDACHFYPRVTRALGKHVIMTAAFSCPAALELGLAENTGFSFRQTEVDRLPSELKDYAPAGMTGEEALAIHEAFLKAALDDCVAPERILCRLGSVSRSLQMIPVASWPSAVPFYLQHADARLIPAQPKPEDPFHLLHALAGLLGATRKSARPRLEQTIEDMSRALHVAVNPATQGISLSPDSLACYHALQRAYHEDEKEWLEPLLRRYIAGQLSLALFPFAGLGATLAERITIIGVRFATVKLALLCALSLKPDKKEAVLIRVMQSLSRFQDHLADPELSLKIYEETGWIHEARLRGLLEDR